MTEIIPGRSFQVEFGYNFATGKAEDLEASIVQRESWYGEIGDKSFIQLSDEAARWLSIAAERNGTFEFKGQRFRVIDRRFDCRDWIVVEDSESYLALAWKFNRLYRLVKRRLIWTLAIWNLARCDQRREVSWTQINLVGKLSLWFSRMATH